MWEAEPGGRGGGWGLAGAEAELRGAWHTHCRRSPGTGGGLQGQSQDQLESRRPGRFRGLGLLPGCPAPQSLKSEALQGG